MVIGLKIVEVAHDNCSTVKNAIEKDFHMINSFDTWHGKLNTYIVLLIHTKVQRMWQNV